MDSYICIFAGDRVGLYNGLKHPGLVGYAPPAKLGENYLFLDKGMWIPEDS